LELRPASVSLIDPDGRFAVDLAKNADKNAVQVAYGFNSAMYNLGYFATHDPVGTIAGGLGRLSWELQNDPIGFLKQDWENTKRIANSPKLAAQALGGMSFDMMTVGAGAGVGGLRNARMAGSAITTMDEANAFLSSARAELDALKSTGINQRAVSTRILNLGGEIETPGALLLNNLQGNLSPVSKIQAAGTLIQGDMTQIPFKAATISEIVGNRMPFIHGEWANSVASEAYRVTIPGGVVRLQSTSGGGNVWLEYLQKAGFEDVKAVGVHAVGQKR
jgi:hypothetical protein